MIPKFKFVRLLIGFPMFLVGFGIAMLGALGYPVGCFISLLGLHLISKAVNYELTGIGFALMGFPIFCWAMLPDGLSLLSGYLQEYTLGVIRLVFSFIGGLCIFASFNSEK